jgi:hypothetical protein
VRVRVRSAVVEAGAEPTEDISGVVIAGGGFFLRDATRFFEATFWADDAARATASSFCGRALAAGFFFLARYAALGGIRNSMEESNHEQKMEEKREVYR